MEMSMGMSSGDTVIQPNDGNPNPHNFEMISCKFNRGYTWALVKYPDCKNHEGMKFLLYKGDVAELLRKRKVLDPHFLETGLSPVARFAPNEEGIEALNLIIGIE